MFKNSKFYKTLGKLYPQITKTEMRDLKQMDPTDMQVATLANIQTGQSLNQPWGDGEILFLNNIPNT
jgi:hypothetical protein